MPLSCWKGCVCGWFVLPAGLPARFQQRAPPDPDRFAARPVAFPEAGLPAAVIAIADPLRFPAVTTGESRWSSLAR